MSYTNVPLVRILLSIISIVGLTYLSPWVVISCMMLLCLKYRAYEVLLLGICADWLYMPTIHSIPYITIIGVILLWGFEPLRREMIHA